MNTKKIIILITLIVLFLSLNSIYAIEDNTTSSTSSIYENQLETNANANELAENTVYVDVNSESTNEDGSIDNPYKNLNNENLEKIASNSTIYVSKGTYNLDSINITKDISIIGESTDEVIFLQTSSISTFIIGSDSNVKFVNFTLRDFTSSSNAAITNNGNLTIENLNLINNVGTTTANKGGSILNNGNLEVINSTFESNKASYGAAIYNTKNTAVYGSTFDHNYIYNVGGAIYSLRGNLTVYDSIFTENSAVSGAAIYNAAGYLYVNNTQFIENEAHSFFGGAIYSTGTTVTENSQFIGNIAVLDGGAIVNTNNFTINNCLFEENFANENGGVIENVPWSEGEIGVITITNSSFTANAAGNMGGVFVNYDKPEAVGDSGRITVKNSLFAENSATTGGVIYNEQYMDFQNNVFINNEANEYNVIYSDEESIISIDNNWWASNNPTIEEIGVMPNNWRILKFTNETALVKGYKSKVTVSLNALNDGTIVDEQIPAREVIFSTEPLSIENVNNTVIEAYILSDEDVVEVMVDNQVAGLNISDRTDTVLSIDALTTVMLNDNVTITGTLKNADGKILTSANIKVSVNEVKYSVKTNKTGVYSLTVVANTTGNNTVLVTYVGNSKFNPTNLSTSFMVKKDAVLSVDPIITVMLDDNVTITGTLKNAEGKVLTSANIKVSVNGVKYSVKTDKKGVYSLTIAADTKGNNSVIVSYAGNSKFNPTSISSSFLVKQNTLLSVNPIADVNLNDNVTITGTLKSDSGKILTSANIKVKVNGVTSTVKTNSKGVYTFTTKTNKLGTNNVTVTYTGNSKFTKSNVNTTFMVS